MGGGNTLSRQGHPVVSLVESFVDNFVDNGARLRSTDEWENCARTSVQAVEGVSRSGFESAIEYFWSVAGRVLVLSVRLHRESFCG